MMMMLRDAMKIDFVTIDVGKEDAKSWVVSMVQGARAPVLLVVSHRPSYSQLMFLHVHQT
jgi:hypothetical protein